MKKFEWQVSEKKFFAQTKDEWKLDVMLEALEYLGNPQNEMDKADDKKVIHIAGTNGKGSTASYIRTILEEAGYKVGCFTSPHLVEYNERFYFNGRFATDEEIEKCKREILQKCKNIEEISYFEASTLIAILLFSWANLDYFIFEVGLGGRLDATNIFKNPLACVITSISFDHMEFLGDTLDKIAMEKGGIIKENCNVWTSNTNKEVVDVLQKIANEKKATLFCQGRDYEVDEELKPSLLGEYQKSNATLASEVCKFIGIDKEVIKQGVAKTRWSGRLQKVQIIGLNAKRDKKAKQGGQHRNQSNIEAVYLDGAHNEDGIKCLCEFVRQVREQEEHQEKDKERKETKKNKEKQEKQMDDEANQQGQGWREEQNVNIIGVFACLKRKDYKSFFPILSTASFDEIGFYNVPQDVNDFEEPSKLLEISKEYKINGFCLNNFEEISERLATRQAKDKTNIIFVFGSLYFVGYVLEKFVED